MGNVRILSHSGLPFRDREEAGKLLAGELQHLRGQNAVVLGIPRGGVVVARVMSEILQADLDIVLSRKLGTPGHRELAMGSVSEDGRVFLNQDVVRSMGIPEEEIEEEKAHQMAEIERRNKLFRAVLPKVPLKDRIVVVTDDGVATGATAQASLWSVRHENPKRLLAAFPVAPEDTLHMLARDADEVVCLRSPPMFMAVGQFYMRFQQVEDEDVLEMLKKEEHRKTSV